MWELILSALALGLSTGVSCILTCAPFYVPYLIAEDRKMKINLWEFTNLMIGRLIGYVAIGAIFGYLGQILELKQLNFISLISLAILSFIIILYSLNLFQLKLPKFCAYSFSKVKPPFFIGLLTGLNLCPPFLLSLNYVFILGSTTKGIIFFLFFFLATNLYFIPLIFLGKLARLAEFKKLAHLTLIIVSLIFFIYSLYGLIINLNILHL
jgi:sulfite exporter TauE/SafE